MEEKIKKICERYKIEVKDKKYCLNDIMTNIIMSKDPYGYIRKHFGYIPKIGNKSYLTKQEFIELINKGKSYHIENCKKFINNQIQELEKEKTIDDFKKEQFLWLTDGNECWVRAKDITDFLGYYDTKFAMKMYVTVLNKKQYKAFNKDRFKLSMYSSHNSKVIEPNTLFINESGLYSLTLKSNKPHAILFRNWVCDEVLPSIRKTGKYDATKSINPIAKAIIKDIDINKYIGKNCFYILNIGDGMYKYGITDKMADRSASHNTTFKSDAFIEIFELPQMSNCRIVENKTRSFLKKRNLNCTFKKQTEIFKPTDDISFETILDTIKQYIAIETEQIKPAETNIDKQIEQDKIKLNQSIINLLSEGKINIEQYKNIIDTLIINNKPQQPQIIQNQSEQQQNNTKGNNDDDNIVDEIEEVELETEHKKCITCDAKIRSTSTHCIPCSNKEKIIKDVKAEKRPTYKQIMKELETNSYVKVGKKFGVSDNMIRKYIKSYEKHDLKDL